MNTVQIISTIVAAAATIIVGVLSGMQWLMKRAKKSGTDEHRLISIKSTVHALDCRVNNDKITAVSTRVESVDKNLSEHKTAINDFNKKISEILESVSYIKGAIDIRPLLKDTNLVVSRSPMTLSDDGEEIAQKTDMYNRIEKNWDSICKVFDKQNLHTPYDIDKYCFEMATLKPELFLTESDINFMKDYSFKEGKSLQYYAGVIGVLVRDRYFKEKNIPLYEVDQHINTANVNS